jgi:hypothetical protein
MAVGLPIMADGMPPALLPGSQPTHADVPAAAGHILARRGVIQMNVAAVRGTIDRSPAAGGYDLPRPPVAAAAGLDGE